MADIITDELRLLIKAEAGEAIKELGSYKTALTELDAANKSVGHSSDNTTSDIKDQTQAMKEAKAALANAESEAHSLAGSLSSVGEEAGKQNDAIKGSSTAQASAAKGSQAYATGLKQVNNAQTVVKTGALAMGKALLLALGPIATITGTIMLIKNYIGDANEAYAQSEGEARKFAITYRDVAKDAEEAAKDWADTFKYAESTAQSVLGSAGDMYTGMGMSGEAALALAERTTYLGGALSKLNPQIGSASDATKALITATTGEREALKTWGIIISEAAIQTKLLERGQQDLTGAALLNAKAQATLDVAYEQSPNALAAVTSATELAADTNRELSESWKELLELEGQSLNKFFQPIKKALAGWIQNMNEAKRAQLDLMKIDPNTDLIEAYGKTADRVDELANTYENLKAKTSLSKSEQADLKIVMSELATLVPTSVTAWNEYGEAIGVSALAARNFADQQRELRAAEAEYQLLRLQYQRNISAETYATNKADKEAVEAKLRQLEAEKNAQAEIAIIAKGAKMVLFDPKNSGNPFRATIAYLNQFKDKLKDSNIDPADFSSSASWDVLSSRIATTISGYEKLSKEIDDLNIKRSEYTLGMKEYEMLTVQIKQAEAELIMLTGALEDQVKVLEDQVALIPEAASNFDALRRNFENGILSAEAYKKALQSIVDKSKEAAQTDPAPDLTKWQTFVAGITKSANISDAIKLEVKLSPIVDPDNGRALLSEQLDYYQGLINQLWQNKESFSGLDEWQTALDQLVEKYDDVKAKVDANAFKDTISTDQQKAEKVLKKTIEDANKLRQQGLLTEKEMGAVIEKAYRTYDDASGKTKLRQRSQELIATTLTEQQTAMQEILLLETELRILQDEGLVTEKQSKAILEAKRDALTDSLGQASSLTTFIKDSWKEIEQNFFSIDALAKLMADTFADIGSALASGEDALAASGKALQAFVTNLLGELATLAIGAGLRVIAESGWAGVPLALALFALGGIAGIGGGYFSGSGKGLDSSISDTVSDEIKLRQSLNEALEEQLGIEETLLKRQLDRNLISEEDYRDSMLSIQQEKNQGQAQGDALSLVNSLIGEIDAELSSLSGWTKFWTKKDENLESKASDLEGIAKAINSAVSAEELKSLIAQLESYGIDTSSIPAFATGGSFVTSGESIVRIGDNSSGRELVNITPLGSAGFHTGQSIVVNINGPVIGYEDLYLKLEAAGITLKRQKRA